MRIKKEDFEKLSKKKQEKLKDKIKKINEVYSFDKVTYVWITFLKYLIYAFILFLIIIPLWKIAYGDKIVLSLMKVFLITIKILWTAMIVGVLVDIIIIYAIVILRTFKKTKVEKEYFKIEVR